MDLADPHTLDLFLQVYGRLPRAGPGGTDHTLRALRMIPGNAPATVLDLGCGPGAQTLVLADALPEAQLLALDILPELVETARERIRQAGLDARVRVEVGDMAAPPVPPHSQDLLWCEGAIYFFGVEKALRVWHPLLSDAGVIAFTEPIWLQASQPDEIRDWWQSEYPAITDEKGVRDSIGRAGYQTIGFFPLPSEAWTTDYYAPMRSRIAELRERHPDDDTAAEVAEMAEHEILMHDRYSDYYSYGFFIAQPDRADRL